VDVMVVDDHPMWREGVARDLTDAGYHVVAAVGEANSARHAYELWEAAGVVQAPDLLCAKVAANLATYVKERIAVDAIMVDFEGARVVGASPGARERVAAEALA